MERPSTPQDVTQAAVYLFLSTLLLGSVATQDALPHDTIIIGTVDVILNDNSTLDTLDALPHVDKAFITQDDLSIDNRTLDTLDALSADNSTIDTLDVLPHENGSHATLDVLSRDSITVTALNVSERANSTPATLDALSQDNSTLARLDSVSSDSSSLVTKGVISHDTSTPLSDMTTIDPASCAHMGLCHTGLVCGCYYYKRRDRLGRIYRKAVCRKMVNCSQKNLTREKLWNIDFSQFNDTILDIRMEENELKVEDIDSLGQHIYQNTKTEHTILHFGNLTNLPCLTIIYIQRRRYDTTSSITEVRCNNRNLTDKDIEDMVLPASTSRLWLQHNKLTRKARLEAKMQKLQHLEQVDLSYNNLTAIPRVNVSQKIKPPENHFAMILKNNSIKSYDPDTLKQYYADDNIFITLDNNPFVCNCKAYYTNDMLVKHGNTNRGLLKCLMPDEITGENKLISLPTKEDEYWKNQCEALVQDRNGYFYLIFSWHNLLDFCLILANVFVIYIVYDLYMAIRETRFKRKDPKATNLVRRDSIKSNRSNRRESTVLRKISKFSRKGSQADSVLCKSHSLAPRRPLLDVMICKVKKGYENANNFIQTRLFTKKVQVLDEEENGSNLDEEEHKFLRESALESMRNSQNYETKL